LGEQALTVDQQKDEINVDIKREISDVAYPQTGARPLMRMLLAGIRVA
tara:strand:- start:26 stop:169 length:144 start_codon:yes stop_codon:yes gene_type:complete